MRSWEEQGALRAVRLFLEGHGVPAAAAARIYRALGPGAIEMLQTDPYATTEVEGIGFATADALARALGTPPDAPSRIDAGLLHALHQAEGDGHCHLPREEVLARAWRLLGTDAEDRLDELAAVREARRGGRARLGPGDARDRAAPGPQRPRAGRVAAGAAPPRGRQLERPVSGAFVPTDAQWEAVTNALEHRLSILTGLPGTGKTQTMRALVDLLRDQKRSVRAVRADRQGGAAARRAHRRARRARSTGCSSTCRARASRAGRRTRSRASTC